MGTDFGQIGRFSFAAPLWRYQGTGNWHFITVPVEVSADIEELSTGIRRGFGSVRVVVTVGGTRWRTSVFPDGKSGTYLLPVKKAVREAEDLEVDEDVPVSLELADL